MRIFCGFALTLLTITAAAQTQENKHLKLPPEFFNRPPYPEPEWISCADANGIRHLRVSGEVQAVKLQKHSPIAVSKDLFAAFPTDELRVSIKVDDKGHPYCFGLPKEDTAEKMKLTAQQRSALLNEVADQLKKWEYQVTYLQQHPVYVESWVLLVKDNDHLVTKRDKK